MQFTVPKFIGEKPVIVGSLNIVQVIYIVIGGVLALITYYTVKSGLKFLLMIIFIGIGAALALVKIQGESLPSYLLGFLKFSSTGKLYIWEKKNIPPKIIRKEEFKKTEKKEVTELKVAEKSRLRNLSNKIEL